MQSYSDHETKNSDELKKLEEGAIALFEMQFKEEYSNLITFADNDVYGNHMKASIYRKLTDDQIKHLMLFLEIIYNLDKHSFAGENPHAKIISLVNMINSDNLSEDYENLDYKSIKAILKKAYNSSIEVKKKLDKGKLPSNGTHEITKGVDSFRMTNN